jgi:CcmD family protein
MTIDTTTIRRMLGRAAAYLGALAVTTWPALLRAQQPGNSEAAAEETIHGGWLVIAAYIVLWVGIMAYVGWLAWRQRQLDSELQDLEDRIDRELEQLADTPE